MELIKYKGFYLSVKLDHQPAEPGNGIPFASTTIDEIYLNGDDAYELLENQFDEILTAIKIQNER